MGEQLHTDYSTYVLFLQGGYEYFKVGIRVTGFGNLQGLECMRQS